MCRNEASDLEGGAPAVKDETTFEEEGSDDGHDHHGGGNNGWCRGVIKEFKMTIGTHWKDEMTNMNFRTIGVSFFMFIAAVAPAITFGAVYAKSTNNFIGAIEMIVATAWCGIVYGFIGGQPMVRVDLWGYKSVSRRVGRRARCGESVSSLAFWFWFRFWIWLWLWLWLWLRFQLWCRFYFFFRLSLSLSLSSHRSGM
jgi:hypothetical protein